MKSDEKQLQRIRNRENVTPYDLFIIAITLLSLVNLILFLFVKQDTLLTAIGIIDVVISGFFLADFIRLFSKAESKFSYFFKDFGWADLLASLPYPQFKLLRIFRLVKAYSLIGRAGFRGVLRGVDRSRASAALLAVLFTIILLLEFGSVGILVLEQKSPYANIKTASDAIWWVYVTITTVGYGDKYPVTNGGRVFATFVMLVGVGLFGVVTGFLANKFLPISKSETVKDEDVARLHEELKEVKALLVSQQKTKTTRK